MLNFIKQIGLILLFALLSSSGSVLVANEAENGNAGIPQQNQRVRGKIQDAMGPIAGASVAIKGTTIGTISDIDGNFSLEISNGQTIQISFIGYTTQEIRYTGQSSINVTLVEDTKVIEEVVVTALGIKREKKALGYATQELKGDALIEARENNLANALSGKVSGLQVVRSSNGPGGSSKIVLRGNSSLTGSNQPLIVIDGVPMDNFTGGVADVWGNEGPDMGNGLGDINP
ncbi:MAG TPA: SusC/RagA family TonB-linked outer membrane protein, partial [Porphyromonadaceae bacterium]|nr:SusC/RagA family TonB-linked outer membrane protein [Porphyromonadaceae bacterium]